MERLESNKTVVEKLFTHLVAANIDGVLSEVADDVSWEMPHGTPFAGRHDGKDGIRRLVAVMRETFPTGMKLHDLTIYADADRVFAEFGWSGWMHTGSTMKDRDVAVFEVVFGKVTAVRQYRMG